MSDSKNGHSEGHHITPFKVFVLTCAGLLILTVITVITAQYDLGGNWNIIVAMIIATIKASLVVLFFMGLKYDRPLNRLIFFTSIVFLSIFFILTFSDLLTRGEVYKDKAVPIEELKQ